jgi:hypothetical protein
MQLPDAPVTLQVFVTPPTCGDALTRKEVGASPMPAATVTKARASPATTVGCNGALGAAEVTVRVKVCVAVLVTFVAVIVYTVADCTVVGAPDNKPVDVLNVVPAGASGSIE